MLFPISLSDPNPQLISGDSSCRSAYYNKIVDWALPVGRLHERHLNLSDT